MQIRTAVLTVWALVALYAFAHCAGCGSAVFTPEGQASYAPATNELNEVGN